MFLLFATLFSLPFALYFGLGKITAYTIILGLITGLAYFFYNLALKNIEAETSSIITIIISPITTHP